MPDNITTPETDETEATAAEATTAEATAAEATTAGQQPARPARRIVSIGGVTIVLDAAFSSASIDEIKQHLAQSGYPEAANATVTTKKNAAGDEIISFLPIAGRKG